MSEGPDEHGFDILSLHSELAVNPQPTYRMLQEGSPVLRVDGVGVIVSSRAAVDEILRDPETFSSNMDATDLKTRRPLIPLQIDPPAHRTYRKLLDPLFAPQRVAVLEHPVTDLVNELIDGLVDKEEIDFARQFSVPFPSQVFLTLLGLPLEELPRFVGMKDGVIRPDHVAGEPRGNLATEQLQQETADSIYAYFEDLLDERGSERRNDLVSQFLDAEVDGERLSHENILDICFLFLIAGLDTVSASLDCFFGYLGQHAEQRQAIVDRPDLIPGVVRNCCAGRRRSWRSLGLRRTTPSWVGARCTPANRSWHSSAPRTSTTTSSPRPARCSSTAPRIGTSRSAAESIGVWVRTSRASNCASRCASGIVASPSTA